MKVNFVERIVSVVTLETYYKPTDCLAVYSTYHLCTYATNSLVNFNAYRLIKIHLYSAKIS